jgi:hypothetical protein
MLRQELPQISFRISVPQFSSLTYLNDNSFHIFFKTPIRNTYNQTQIQLSLCLAYSVNVSYTQSSIDFDTYGAKVKAGFKV